MKKTLVFAAAMIAAGQGVAQAQGFDLLIGLEGSTAGDEFAFTGGKPSQPLEGAFVGGLIGAEYDFGGLTLGAAYHSSFNGIAAEAQRDGNYLVQGGSVDRLSSLELEVGYRFENGIRPFAGWGVAELDATTWQSCPNDVNAVVAGFCGSGDAPTRLAKQGRTEGDYSPSGDIWRIGLTWDVSGRVRLGAAYYSASFEREIVPFDKAVIPATNPALEDLSGVTLSAAFKLF